MRYDPERIKRRLVAVELADVYRIIRHRYQGTPLGAVPAPSRFSDPEGRYAVLYASELTSSQTWPCALPPPLKKGDGGGFLGLEDAVTL